MVTLLDGKTRENLQHDGDKVREKGGTLDGNHLGSVMPVSLTYHSNVKDICVESIYIETTMITIFHSLSMFLGGSIYVDKNSSFLCI